MSPGSGSLLGMADRTDLDILIDAAPASSVMAVIADFPAYPDWAQG